MSLLLVAVWLGFLALLVNLKILKGWALWMKLSPIAIWLLSQVFLLLPMGSGAPSGSAVVLKHTVQIIPSVSGPVIDIPIESGRKLTEGEVLFRIDPVPYQSEVDVLEAQLTLARQVEGRQIDLAKGNATAQQDVDRASAKVRELKARLTAAQWNLEHTVVRAPADGFVTDVILRPGATVAANSSQVMSFIDESELMIAAQIDQINLRHIKAEQPAEVIFKLYPGKVFEAKVVKVIQAAPSGQVAASGFALQTFEIEPDPFWVELELKDKSLSLPPGAVGTVAVYTDRGNVSHTFRKIFLRMENWLNFVRPF